MILPSNEFLEVFKSTEGALSVTESIAIMNLAAQAPKGNHAIEFGVYRGKSALSAVQQLKDEKFWLIEPEFENKYWCDEVCHKVRQYVDKGVVFCMPSYSTDWLKENSTQKYGYVFIDSGSHQDGLPMLEVRLLEDMVVEGGIVAFHDFQSQFKEVEEAYDYLVSTGKYDPIIINWNEIISVVKENDWEKGNKSWHHTELEFPCFVGALKRK